MNNAHDKPMEARPASLYEGFIDGTQFSVVANYLESPRSPICFLLHVKEEAQLTELAAQPEPVLDSPHRMREVLDSQLRDGTLQISSRMPLPESFPGNRVDPKMIQPTADCKVIWMEPFYLVHTPGLFEGEVQVHTNQKALKSHQDRSQPESQTQSRSKTHDYSMSH